MQKEQANIIDKKDQKEDEFIFVVALFLSVNNKKWYINSSASQHMVVNQS